MVRKALNSQDLTVYGDGNYLRDYIFIDDVIRAFILAYKNIDACNGRHFIIASGESCTISDMVRLVAERMRGKTGRCAKVVNIAPPDNLSPIESRNFVADISKFKQITSWSANISLRQGIDITLDFYLKDLQNQEKIRHAPNAAKK